MRYLQKGGRPHVDRPQVPGWEVWEETPGVCRLSNATKVRFSKIGEPKGHLRQCLHDTLHSIGRGGELARCEHWD